MIKLKETETETETELTAAIDIARMQREANEKKREEPPRAEDIFYTKYPDQIPSFYKKGRENATIICNDCKKEIYKQEMLVITPEGKTLHSYHYFANGISKETFNRLKNLPRVFTNLEECINLLITHYEDIQ